MAWVRVQARLPRSKHCIFRFQRWRNLVGETCAVSRRSDLFPLRHRAGIRPGSRAAIQGWSGLNTHLHGLWSGCDGASSGSSEAPRVDHAEDGDGVGLATVEDQVVLEVVFTQVGTSFVRHLADLRKCLDPAKGIPKQRIVQDSLLFSPRSEGVSENRFNIPFRARRNPEPST